MHLEIYTPDKKLFSGDVIAVKFPGSDGSFGVKNNHAAIISTLKPGEIKITDSSEKEQKIDVKGGVVEVVNNKIIVLAE